MQKRVAIYCRVSTKDQTTENQLQDLRKHCESRGWKIIAEHLDNGISGAKDDRPNLKATMELARKRKIDVLLVWRFDRFARSLSHLVNTLEELRSLGVDFVSYQESVDTALRFASSRRISVTSESRTLRRAMLRPSCERFQNWFKARSSQEPHSVRSIGIMLQSSQSSIGGERNASTWVTIRHGESP
jgi:hypothetical protein